MMGQTADSKGFKDTLHIKGQEVKVKLFGPFRLDHENHMLWRNGNKISLAPKAFDVLAYVVEHAGQVVSQDQILEALWADTYVNPEILRRYILEIRKALGDRPGNPEFIETVPKRGYRFVARVADEVLPDLHGSSPAEEAPEPGSSLIDVQATLPKPESSSVLSKLWKFAVVAAIVIAATATYYFWFSRSRVNSPSLANTSIAVLPFADISPTKDQEYFSDGITEQLISELAKVSGLKVVGRSSAFQFKGKNEDLREIGHKLGVSNVLEGSVRREGNHVRITAELIKADDGFQLWSQTYDREIKDIFNVQDEIARAATQALQPKLIGSNGQPIPSNLQNTNSEAYQAYLRAKYFVGRGRSKEDLEKALAYTDTAIKLDDRYAPAWALRAWLQNTMSEAELIDATQGYREARNDAERAIALDPNSAAAYLALATNQLDYDWDWAAANGFVTKAAVLEPGSIEVLRVRSNLFWVLGDLNQAIKLREQVVALDPLRVDSFLDLTYLLYLAGQYREAHEELQKGLDLNPQTAFAHFDMALLFMAEGMPQRALAESEKEQSDWAKLTARALANHALGREQDSNVALTQLIAAHQTDSAFQIAEVYAFCGKSDQAFQWLQRAYEQRDPGLAIVKTDPLLKGLRRDERYTALLKKMNLAT
jgi:TolB-like protein/DNA-binding winged helix-turn-helix (wHTH) protein/Tfp pilus assembly protein PilF